MTLTHDLNGQWELTGPEDLGTLTAHVPGSIHYDLRSADVTPNPFGSTADATANHWVSATSWRLERTFTLSSEEALSDWVLYFGSLDTFATVLVNDQQVATSRNALRSLRVSLKPEDLRAGENRLAVLIDGHEDGVAEMIDEARARLRHDGPIEGLLGKSLLRRYQRSFFSMSSLLNIGTGVLGIGILGRVELRRVETTRIEDVFFETVSIDKMMATARCTVSSASEHPGELTVELLDSSGVVVAHNEELLQAGTAETVVHLEIVSPALWWPIGYGDSVLYTLRTQVRTEGRRTATVERQVGIRTVQIRTESTSGRPTFEVVVNGTPIWVRGTNYIPVDYLSVYGTAQQYERVFALLEAGNNNMVRMWGGGATESAEWYEECDRRGILVWQDFYLHSNTYPDYDAQWVAEFAAEARELIQTVRSHPSVVVLCGGNEQREGWEEWHWKETIGTFHGESLVTEIIPHVLEETPSGLPYVNNSPHGGLFSQSPIIGDAHVWGNHYNSTKDPLFVTETCWGQESYSRPETLESVMGIDVDSYVGPDWPKRWKETTSLPLLLRFPYSGYHSIGGLRAYLKDLEIEQAMADHHSLSNFRLRAPSCRGILYWSFNKGGPLFQFGSVDYELRPLMSYYFVSRLNRPVVVGAHRDGSDIRVMASNGTADSVAGTVEAWHLDGEGNVLNAWTADAEIPPGAPVRILDLDGAYTGVVDRATESVHVRLSVEGEVLSEDHLLFCPLVEFRPQDSELAVSVQAIGENTWELSIAADGVHKMIEIEGLDDFILDDNYFPVVKGRPHMVRIRSLRESPLPRFTVSSLDSTFPAEHVVK